jgi:glycosyltransferase involved in cell wall biosynthesis
MKRVQLGWTDYANTLTPEMGGPLGTPVPSCQFVYLGINTNNYIPSLAKDIYFLWLNRWHETKGYKLAIEIAKITKLPFIMAGEHPDNETNDHQRKCAIEAHELASHVPNITFMWLPSGDKHNEVKKMLYQQAKALIYTTQFQEPFGLSQVEALASGTPVIAPDYGSCPEIIRHGIDGFICDNDPKAFANACHQIGMIDTKDCRNRAVNTFDRKVSAQNWITEYTRIIK